MLRVTYKSSVTSEEEKKSVDIVSRLFFPFLEHVDFLLAYVLHHLLAFVFQVFQLILKPEFFLLEQTYGIH